MLAGKKGQERRLDFVGVGSARCGTTWVAQCLDEHPELFVAAKKELHFFNDDRRWHRHGLAWLDHQFDYDFPGLIGEYTPRYLLQDLALQRIQETFPQTKILVMLRDPLRRALSQFQYFRYDRYKEPESDFRRALEGASRVDYLGKSLYAGQMRQLLKRFARDKIFIGLFETFTAEPRQSFSALFHFLSVDSEWYSASASLRVNASGLCRGVPRPALARLNRFILTSRSRIIHNSQVKKFVKKLIDRNIKHHQFEEEVKLEPEDLKKLWHKYFRNDVQELEKVCGLDFSQVWGKYE